MPDTITVASGATDALSSPSVDSPASATATPDAGSSTPLSSSAEPSSATSGEPPKERWNDILTNARQKARAEVEAESRQKYGKYDAFEQDPWKAVTGWMDTASQHSMYSPMVQSWVENYVQTYLAKSPAGQGEEPKPDIPVVDDQGRVTHHTYSAEMLREWRKWNKAQEDRQTDQRLRPIEQKLEAYERREQQQRSDWQARQKLDEFGKLPYFTEYKSQIATAFHEHPEFGDNLHAAYVHVLTNEILPKLSQVEQAKVVDSLNQKATASTVNPSQSVVGRPKFKSFRDAAKYYEEHPDEAAAMAAR